MTSINRLKRLWHRPGSTQLRDNIRHFCKRNGLLTLSVISVITGCTLGFTLRGTQLSTQAKIYFSFPGELLMRMLKMLILPLITSSLMSGLSSMESKACCRMGVLTVTYYLWTTFIAVVVGIVLVLIVKPGVGTEMESNRLGGGPVMTSADALLDLISGRRVNVLFISLFLYFQKHGSLKPGGGHFSAGNASLTSLKLYEPFDQTEMFLKYKTDLLPILKVPTRTAQPNFVYVIPDESAPSGRTVYLELTPPPEVHYRTGPGTSQQMNVLGIVIFSAVMGQPVAGQNGERGAPLVNVCQCINECVMKIINAAVWYFPFGIIFLVAGKILDMADPSTLGKKLGWYGLTVLTGLFVHGLILLPLFYFILTRKNPFKFIRGLLQAMVIALATSSSSATLPITMKCLLENCNVDRQIARFVLPVGATINMDGTALYEAVAAIFIAQVNDYELDFGQIVTISITATAASVGAAGIPHSKTPVCFRDRFRTMINVLGDALAAGIIAHLCRKDFPLKSCPSSSDSWCSRTDVVCQFLFLFCPFFLIFLLIFITNIFPIYSKFYLHNFS
uniref:Amino acid transporter n=1 Tax=Neogobius melanostomus TaxID=47308 RepID=A0A8C6WRU7_9GOBI